MMEKIAGEYDWDFAQIQLNYLEWETCDAKTQYQILEKRWIPVLVMQLVRGRALYLDQNSTQLLRAGQPASQYCLLG